MTATWRTRGSDLTLPRPADLAVGVYLGMCTLHASALLRTSTVKRGGGAAPVHEARFGIGISCDESLMT